MSLTSGNYPNKMAYLDGVMIAEIYSSLVGEKDPRDKYPRGEFIVYATEKKGIGVLRIGGKDIPVKVAHFLGKHEERVLSLTSIKG